MIRRGIVPAGLSLVLLVAAAIPVFGQSASHVSITSNNLPVATAGIAYSFPLRATGGVAPYRWSVVDSQPGIGISSGGVLSLSPQTNAAPRVISFTVKVVDSSGSTATSRLTLTISPRPTIFPEKIGGLFRNRAVRIPFTVVGGVDPSAVKLSRGTLPPGVGLSAGVLVGAPRQTGTYQFELIVSDRNGAQAVRAYTLVVADLLSIGSGNEPPLGSIGAPYSFRFTASGGVGPMRWTRVSGRLPPGIELAADGTLSGVPTSAGKYTFTVSLTDAGIVDASAVTKMVTVQIDGMLSILTPSPLATGVEGKDYFLAFRVAGGIPPLQWSVTGGKLPDGLTLTAAGELRGIPSPAAHHGFLIRVIDGAGRSVDRNYTLTIDPGSEGSPAKLVPEYVRFAVPENGSPENRTVQIARSSRSSAEYRVRVTYFGRAGDWLRFPETVQVPAGRDTAGLPLEANAQGLAPGSYQANLLVEGPDLDKAILPVSLIVTGSAGYLGLTPVGVTFEVTEGGPAPPSKSVSVVSRGAETGGGLPWTTSAEVLSEGPNWLRIIDQTGVSSVGGPPGKLSLAVDQTGLTRGDYYGLISVKSDLLPGMVQVLTVVLRVRPPDNPAQVLIEPQGLVVSSLRRPVRLTNLALEPVKFYASPSISGVVIEPSTLTLEPGVTETVMIEAQDSHVPDRHGLLNLAFSDSRSQSVDLRLLSEATAAAVGHIGSATPRSTSGSTAGSARATAADGSTASAACTPTQLVPISTLFGSNFSVPAGWPTPIEVRVVDDCGTPLEAGVVTVAFSNGDPSMSLTSLGGGRWSGTWTGRNAITPQVTVTVAAEDRSRNLTGSYQLTGGMETNVDPPIVNAGSVVNAASFVERAPLAPGSLISIFGSKLASTQIRTNSLPLDTTLGLTTVTLGGKLLPLLYADDQQVNAVVPSDIPLNVPQGLLVRRGTSLSVPESVVVTDAQPGVFTVGQKGDGQALAVDQTGRVVDASNPAQPGQAITIYLTGLGVTAPAVNVAFAAPITPVAKTQSSVAVTIGEQSADVAFAGLVPGLTGLYQINTVVPAGTIAGEAVPVVVSASQASSPTVTIAVKP